MPEIKEKLCSLSEAADLIKDGTRIAFGSMGVHNHPMAFINELIRKEVKDLTVHRGLQPKGRLLRFDVSQNIACFDLVTALNMPGDQGTLLNRGVRLRHQDRRGHILSPVSD